MSDPRDHKDAYIPADDVLLRGYCGPCEIQIRMDDEGPPDWMIAACVGGGVERAFWADQTVLVADRFYVRLYRLSVVRLDPALAPVRDHIARVMAEGVRCPACGGRGWSGTVVGDRCSHCTGGYLLPPSPIEHLMDRHGSRMTAAQSAACVAWSYRSWRRGGAMLRGVLTSWASMAPHFPDAAHARNAVSLGSTGDGVGGRPGREVAVCHPTPGRVGWFLLAAHAASAGPETGPDGRACADRAALAHNFALINDDGSVTTPELPTDRSPN